MEPNVQKNAEKVIFEVTIWEGDYGLISTDLESLSLITFLKLVSLRYDQFYVVKLKPSRNPIFYTIPQITVKFMTKTNEVFLVENIQTLESLMHFMQIKEIKDTDCEIETRKQAQVKIYLSYIKQQILPAVLYTFWIDEITYTEMTRKWFRNALFFPFNLVYPWYRRCRIEKHLQSLVGGEDVVTYEEYIMKTADDAINVLIEKMGNGPWFMGNGMTSVDVLLYSYLMPLLKAPIPSFWFVAKLQRRKQFCDYLRQCEKTLYSKDTVSVKYKYLAEPKIDENEVRSSTGSIVLALLCAGTVMIGYGMLVGAIKNL